MRTGQFEPSFKSDSICGYYNSNRTLDVKGGNYLIAEQNMRVASRKFIDVNFDENWEFEN